MTMLYIGYLHEVLVFINMSLYFTIRCYSMHVQCIIKIKSFFMPGTISQHSEANFTNNIYIFIVLEKHLLH